MMLAKALASASASAPKVYVEDVFSTWLYTGNGSTQTITNGIDLSGKGGLVWVKPRATGGNGNSHALVDTARGAGNALFTNLTNAQDLTSPARYVSAFSSTGFSLDEGIGYGVNSTNIPYASWTFRKAAKFFDVVTWVGDGTVPRQISHNLGSVPGAIFVKRTDSTGDWHVFHRSAGGNLVLNSNSAEIADNRNVGNTIVTSSVFDIGASGYTNLTNINGASYVAYLFAHDAGGFGDSGNDSVVKCGSYTGNGSTSGPTVTLDWEPQWLLIKRTNTTGDWQLIDNMRGFVVGGTDAELNPNLSNAESTGTFVSPLRTGLQLNTTDAGYNASGSTYIYIAIRRGPMKTPTDATKVFSAVTQSTTGTFTAGFPVDLVFSLRRDAVTSTGGTGSRLTGNDRFLRLKFSATDAEVTSANVWDFRSNTEFYQNLTAGSGVEHVFRRAPGFFDVVACSGSAAVRTHSLGVRPELIIGKHRNKVYDWFGAVNLGGFVTNLSVNSANSLYQDTSATWNTYVTATAFDEVYVQRRYNGGSSQSTTDTQVYYLFASCPGVSKVGSYTGTGTTLNVDCGFTAGARFVLIKRTDFTGDWYVWDTARGIIAGNDSYLLLNSNAAEVTNTDYIDPLNSGFQISSTAPAAINASGGSFIFLAIA